MLSLDFYELLARIGRTINGISMSINNINKDNPIAGDSFYEGSSVLGTIDMPLGLGMALAQNYNAMNAFAAMSDSKKRELISGARQIRSKQEMRDYVNMIPNGGAIG